MAPVPLSLAPRRGIGLARGAPPFWLIQPGAPRSVSPPPFGDGGACPWGSPCGLLRLTEPRRGQTEHAGLAVSHARPSAVRAIDPTGCGSGRSHASFRVAVAVWFPLAIWPRAPAPGSPPLHPLRRGFPVDRCAGHCSADNSLHVTLARSPKASSVGLRLPPPGRVGFHLAGASFRVAPSG